MELKTAVSNVHFSLQMADVSNYTWKSWNLMIRLLQYLDNLLNPHQILSTITVDSCIWDIATILQYTLCSITFDDEVYNNILQS